MPTIPSLRTLGRILVGRVVRLCLGLSLTSVFALPREPGLQAAIEAFNGRWQAKVWARFPCA